MDDFTLLLILPAIFLAFTLSAAAGLGGSLLLVPALALALGPKEGIALAALLLAANNVAKVMAYRRTIPIAASAAVLLATMVGAAVGASLLVNAPAGWIHGAIYASVALSLLLEQRHLDHVRKLSSPVLAICAGATSGFSGTSGPLKGLAIRNLGFDRMHFVGACSTVSLAGDLVKAGVYARADLVGEGTLWILFAAAPLMALGVHIGRLVNRRSGERLFQGLFWLVMGSYTIRLIAL